MYAIRKLAFACVSILALAAPATAVPLTIANVSSTVVNCAFGCIVQATTKTRKIPMGDVTGAAVLVSRTIKPRLSLSTSVVTGYAYQVDLSRATAIAKFACISGLRIDFGVVKKRRYGPTGTPENDVFVIVSGQTGTIGLGSADQVGNTITLAFSQPVCTETAGPGKNSFFVGMGSAKKPTSVNVVAVSPSQESLNVNSFAPIR
jgi:hypothetical protein